MGLTLKGSIFNIQHFSTQDGPGIRTTVFFKGCPLGCLWCSNPESQRSCPEIAHRDSFCFGCGDCVKACVPEAITLRPAEEGKYKIDIDRDRCTNCGTCIDACTAGVLKTYGQYMPLEDVFEEVKKDELYYSNSEGGVTASGGEPLAQSDFVYELFRLSRRVGIHTTLDTCGDASPSSLKRVLHETDLVLFDLKTMNSAEHARYTKRDNEAILCNAKIVVSMRVPMIIRVPLIPGMTDSAKNLIETADFVSRLDDTLHIDLLPYHRLGQNKYKMLDRQYLLNDVMSPTEDEQRAAEELFKHRGLDCAIQM